MDVRIPFQIPPEGMQDADKARSKVFGLVKLEEHTQDDIPDRMKQAVKKGMVLKKKDVGSHNEGSQRKRRQKRAHIGCIQGGQKK